MKIPTASFLLLSSVLLFAGFIRASAQVRRSTETRKSIATSPPVSKTREVGSSAVVVDETLSVLRAKPSLFADPIQRMRRGRNVKIIGVAEADGVRFYKVAAPPAGLGWVQSDAVFGAFRSNDEERLARLVQ